VRRREVEEGWGGRIDELHQGLRGIALPGMAVFRHGGALAAPGGFEIRKLPLEGYRVK